MCVQFVIQVNETNIEIVYSLCEAKLILSKLFINTEK